MRAALAPHYRPALSSQIEELSSFVSFRDFVTYLKYYHEKSITRAFYEYELRRATHPDIYPPGKSIAQEKKQSLRKVPGIRWIAQVMDTQRQCVVKIKIYYKIIINLLYTFFYTRIEALLQTYCTYMK